MEVKKKYEKKAKQHSLPTFEKLDNEFEIRTIDEEGFVLREIRRKIYEKLEFYEKILDSLLKPELIIADLHESKVFKEKEREEMFALYKRIMYYNRMAIETSINETDKKTSKFILEIWNEWEEIKQKIEPVIIKIKESWLEDTELDEKARYLG